MRNGLSSQAFSIASQWSGRSGMPAALLWARGEKAPQSGLKRNLPSGQAKPSR